VFLNNKDDEEMVTIAKANTKPMSDPFDSVTSGLVQVRGYLFQVLLKTKIFIPSSGFLENKQLDSFVSILAFSKTSLVGATMRIVCLLRLMITEGSIALED
jgi:hypothetical protein